MDIKETQAHQFFWGLFGKDNDPSIDTSPQSKGAHEIKTEEGVAATIWMFSDCSVIISTLIDEGAILTYRDHY